MQAWLWISYNESRKCLLVNSLPTEPITLLLGYISLQFPCLLIWLSVICGCRMFIFRHQIPGIQGDAALLLSVCWPDNSVLLHLPLPNSPVLQPVRYEWNKSHMPRVDRGRSFVYQHTILSSPLRSKNWLHLDLQYAQYRFGVCSLVSLAKQTE